MVSLIAAPSQEQLRASGGTLPREVLADLRLPRVMPDIIGDTAREVTRGAATHFDEALALQAYFQSGDFGYSLEAPSAADPADGMNVIARFLRDKEGYCVHFASAMAVMARVLGIPSRIGLGYLPGSPGPAVDGRPVYTVTSDDLHAWPELYFAGVGWVPFEPTVSRGAPAQFSSTQANEGGGTVDETQSSTGAVAPQLPVAPTDPGAATVDDGAGRWEAAGRAALAILASIAVLLAPAAVRVLVRRRRLARLARGDGDVWLAWRELCDTAQDLGIPLNASETPRAFAERLMRGRASDSAGRVAVDSLRARLELAAYGGHGGGVEGSDVAQEVEEAVARLVGSASTGARWRARFAPVSLLRPRAQASRILPA